MPPSLFSFSHFSTEKRMDDVENGKMQNFGISLPSGFVSSEILHVAITMMKCAISIRDPAIFV